MRALETVVERKEIQKYFFFVEALTARLESVVERTFVRVPPASTEDQCYIYRKIEGRGNISRCLLGEK